MSTDPVVELARNKIAQHDYAGGIPRVCPCVTCDLARWIVRHAPIVAAAKAQRVAADTLLEALARGAARQPHGMLAATRAATEQAVRDSEPDPAHEAQR